MTKSDIKSVEEALLEDKEKTNKDEVAEKKSTPPKEETVDDKLKTTQEKLLRTMAEMENQRRRFEKEIRKLLNLVDLIWLGNLYHS